MRYVVLHHTGIDEPHYDLMLELAPGASLATWRLPAWPPAPGDQFLPLAAHRRDYLEYEGPVSHNRGHVRRVAGGTFAILSSDASRLSVTFDSGLSLTLPKET
jgi:hypothetical protein